MTARPPGDLQAENAVLRGIIERLRKGWRPSRYSSGEWYRKLRTGKAATESMTLAESIYFNGEAES